MAFNRHESVWQSAIYASRLDTQISENPKVAGSDRAGHLFGEAEVLLRCESLEPRAFRGRQR